LVCLDGAHERTFAAVAEDIITSMAAPGANPRAAIVGTLERWRSFWSVDPTGLSREAALGLFGELWFLSRWIDPIAVAVARWQGPTGARHDFQWEAASVEVKTAATLAGPVVHFIENLDQLTDPVTGALYLFSLQVADDALAANTLPGLVSRIALLLASDEMALRVFTERLGRSGYSPAHAERYNRSLRIIAEDLFCVADGFPRLTRSSFPEGLPPGIDRVSYCLSVAACGAWRVASSPLTATTAFLRTSSS
jgi:hypothetical protein